MLARKQCPVCRRTCYSLSKSGAWICPHCGEDLAKEPFIEVTKSVAGVLPIASMQPDTATYN